MKIKRVYEFFRDNEWIIFLAFINNLAIAITDVADILPDGDAKTFIIVGANMVVAFIGRARVYASATVKALTDATQNP